MASKSSLFLRERRFVGLRWVGLAAVAILVAHCASPERAHAQQYAPMTLLDLTNTGTADPNAYAIWADDIASNTSHFTTDFNRPPPPGYNSPFSVFESIFQSATYSVTIGLASSATTCQSAPNSSSADIEPSLCTMRVNAQNMVTGATTQQEFADVCLLIPSVNNVPAATWGTQAAFDGTTLYVTTLVNGVPSQGCAFQAPVMAP